MALSFEGRTIAVTGGGSGIGLAVTRSIASLGGTVYVADIAAAPPKELVDIKNVYFIGGVDVRSREACKKFIDSIPGRLDGLVNSAGVTLAEGRVASDEIFERTMAINVKGTWNMGTEAMFRMDQQEDIVSAGLLPGTERTVGAGSIVNLASGAAFRGIANMAAYCTSKHAVLGMTRSWAKDFPKLRINAVAPGATDTPMTQSMSGSGAAGEEFAAKMREILKARIPLGRLAYATDIADGILFLLSDSSSFVTGQTIPINGGSD